MVDLFKVTIDGRETLVPKGSLIVEAARQVGIDIPVFCYHEKLTPVGACRMCLVEIEKVPRLQTACTTPVTDGMVVHTDTPQVDKARKGVLEFLLTNHPLDCPVCDKGGECPLQDTTFRYACDRSRFAEEKRHFQKPVQLSDRILLDRERCVMCMRCVRFQREVAGDESLTLLNRGAHSMIGTIPGRSFDSPFSGNTTELCPVGALTSVKFRFRARSWELTKTPSVCTLCSVGCNVKVEHRNGEVLRLTSRENPAVDDGWLCDWGRFSYDFVNDSARLTTPMIRKDGELVPATWQEALEAVAVGLREAAADGGSAVSGLISPNATNEELYLFQKLFRVVLGSNNVDHGLHGTYTLPDRGIDAPVGSIAGLESAAVIILAGVDPLATHPVLDLRLKKAAKKGARLLTVSSKQIDLAKLRGAAWMQTKQNGEAAVVKGLVRALLSETSLDVAARERLGDGYDAVAGAVAEYTPQVVAEVAGVESAVIEQLAALLAGTSKVAIVHPRPVPGAPAGLQEACDWLAVVTGAMEDPAGGVFPLGRGGNSQGALDMGVVPTLLPGQVWAKGNPGFSGAEIMEAAGQGRIKGMYLVGMDPVGGRDPDAAGAALEKVGFLVVQDLFLTATARSADVVLPGASFAEKDGTVTNLERRVQRLTAAVPCRGKARPDWEIIASIAVAMGAGWSYSNLSDVTDEIAYVVPAYRGMSLAAVGEQGIQRAYQDTEGAAKAAEQSNGHDRKLWYQPVQRETEPEVAGA